MSWLDGARTRVRLVVARRAAESRMNEEFRFHIEMEADRLVRESGLAPDEARRRALAAFGGVENHKEALRSDRGLAWLAGISLDLKLGLRMLVKHPGLTLIGGVGMAVAVAVGAVSFGIIYTFIGSQLPFDEGHRIVAIQNVDAGSDNDGRRTHLHDLATWRERLRAVSDLGAYRTIDRNLITPDARAEPVRIAEMTASGFRIARVPPIVGRYLDEWDERTGAPPVVVIGYGVWQDRFAGRRDIVGQTLRLGATSHTIVGVMPAGFAFPINNRVWTPLRLDPAEFERGEAPAVDVFGRLTPNATVEDARLELATIERQLATAYPATHGRVRTRVLPYTRAFVESPELVWAFHLMQVLVSMLLVVIGTNVAVLVYARTANRMGEIAVRTALGASRRRVVSQLFAEALVLTTGAAAVGLACAWLVLREVQAILRRVAGEQVPFWMEFAVTQGMVIYVSMLAVLAAVIVGVLPALKATRRRVHANLQHLGPGGSGMRLGKTWSALIVGQVAVAVSLLPVVVYALVVQRRGEAVPGIEISTKEWITASVRLDREGVGTDDPVDGDSAFAARYVIAQDELVRRLRAEPGVTDVVLASSAPGGEPRVRIEAEAVPGEVADTSVVTAVHHVGTSDVSAEFFRAFGVPVILGREFRASDFSAADTPVIVNRSFVHVVLGGGSALGRRVRASGRGTEGGARYTQPGPWYQIVGVVPDFPSDGSSSTDVRPRLYRPLVPGTMVTAAIAVRVGGAAPANFGGRLRQLAVGVDPMLRLDDVRSLDDAMSIEKMADRVVFMAVALVTGSVVLLSAAGIYALVAFTVSRRRREIGVRAALGAGPRRVLGSVLFRAARQIGIGMGIGIAVATAMVQIMEGGRADPRGVMVLAGVAAFMAAVGLAAAIGPARQALRIQPTEALRGD